MKFPLWSETYSKHVKRLIHQANGRQMYVDEEGVPRIVQGMVYDWSWMVFVVLFFDNSIEVFMAESVGVGLWEHPDEERRMAMAKYAAEVWLAVRGGEINGACVRDSGNDLLLD